MPALIEPTARAESRPMWSVMIPTYNCADYLREALGSVLDQDPGPDVMHIEVVDDASTTDDPEAVVQELGGGRVGFFRQPRNLGQIGNLNDCIRRSRGELVHILNGDDAVRDGFYDRMGAAFVARPDLGAAFCRAIKADADMRWQEISTLEERSSGVLDDWLLRLAVTQRVPSPSMVVRRAVYETIGGFDDDLGCWGEDWEMWVRIAASYPVWFEEEPLTVRRRHDASLTGRTIGSGQNIRDVRRAVDAASKHFPSDRRDELRARALHNYALYAVETGQRRGMSGDLPAARAQLREALRCAHDPGVVMAVAAAVARLVLHRLRVRSTDGADLKVAPS